MLSSKTKNLYLFFSFCIRAGESLLFFSFFKKIPYGYGHRLLGVPLPSDTGREARSGGPLPNTARPAYGTGATTSTGYQHHITTPATRPEPSPMHKYPMRHTRLECQIHTLNLNKSPVSTP